MLDPDNLLTFEQAMIVVEAYEETESLFPDVLLSMLWYTPLKNEISIIEHEEEILAIANPVSRDWALENIVAEEKKYVLRAKEKDSDGSHWYVGNEKSSYTWTKTEARVGTKEELAYWKSDALEYVEV